jgi:uracil phosphoribosyltransferase
MNWISVFTALLKLIPYVVQGIETIHTNESTETKTQLAQDALKIATDGAVSILNPGDAATTTAVSTAVSSAITSAQQIVAGTKG